MMAPYRFLMTGRSAFPTNPPPPNMHSLAFPVVSLRSRIISAQILSMAYTVPSAASMSGGVELEIPDLLRKLGQLPERESLRA